MFKKEWCTAGSLFRDSDVITLQEVHGSSGEMQALAHRVVATHIAFCTAGVPETASGVMIFVRHKWMERARTVETTIVPGRVLGVRIMSSSTTLAILGCAQLQCQHLRPRGDPAVDTAIAQHFGAVCFAAGDWNFDASDDGVLTTTGRGDTTSHRARREQARWTGALRTLTALSRGLPTRAAAAEIDDGISMSQSSLDRAYTSLSPTTLAFTDVGCRVAPLGTVLRPGQGAPPSDHATVRTTLSVKTQPCLQNRSIPSWVTRHPLYTINVRRRLASSPLQAITVSDADRRCVQAIRSAAATPATLVSPAYPDSQRRYYNSPSRSLAASIDATPRRSNEPCAFGRLFDATSRRMRTRSS